MNGQWSGNAVGRAAGIVAVRFRRDISGPGLRQRQRLTQAKDTDWPSNHLKSGRRCSCFGQYELGKL